MMRKPKLQDLLSLLQKEREVVTRGEFGGLSDIAARKDQMIAHLKDMNLSRNDVAAVQKDAHRNTQLIAAAIAGVHDAQVRIAALRAASDGLQVYDAKGTTERVGKSSKTLERKA